MQFKSLSHLSNYFKEESTGISYYENIKWGDGYENIKWGDSLQVLIVGVLNHTRQQEGGNVVIGMVTRNLPLG